MGLSTVRSLSKRRGFPELSAQGLREQFILRQMEKKVDLYEIAKKLGLKTVMTLEKIQIMDIKLKDFEGPLDLLLHLVSKYQMDIYDVPITEVIEQYLAYVSTLQAMRLEVAGEYMVMASQLMLIKSRKLLPKVAEVSDLEDDLEQDLLSHLVKWLCDFARILLFS